MSSDNAFERELSVRWKKEADAREKCEHRHKSYDIVRFYNPKTKVTTDFLETTCRDCQVKSYYNWELYKERNEWFGKLTK